MRRVIFPVLLLTLALSLAGCATQTARTAEATGCGVTDVDIVDSAYARDGIISAWCAKCKGKVFQCVSNPERSRVECRPATSPGPCY